MRSLRGALIQHDRCPCKKREQDTGTDREDTVWRRRGKMPPTSRGERSQKKATCWPLVLDSLLSEGGGNKFPSFRPLGHDASLWSPNETNTPTHVADWIDLEGMSLYSNHKRILTKINQCHMGDLAGVIIKGRHTELVGIKRQFTPTDWMAAEPNKLIPVGRGKCWKMGLGSVASVGGSLGCRP